MILKGSTIDYILWGIPKGLYAGCIYGILTFFMNKEAVYYSVSQKINSAIVLGIITGILMYVILTISTIVNAKKVEEKAQILKWQIESERKIICQGAASHKLNKIRGIAGWMFLTEAAVEFYITKGNFGGNNIAILLDDIVTVSINGKKLNISTKDRKYTFVVFNSDVWKQQIENAI